MKSLIELAPKDASLGAGILLRHSGKLCLALDEKGLSKESSGRNPGNEHFLRISAIGGGLEPDEAERGDFFGAALRESKEEAGILPEIESAKRTFFVDYDNSVKEISVSDKVKPALVYRRVYLKGPESWQLFSAVFLATSHSRPEPGDVSGLVFLTPKSLSAISKGFSTIQELESSGAHLVLKGRFSNSTKIFPFGTVEAILEAEKSRNFSISALLSGR